MEAVLAEPYQAGHGNHGRAANGRVRADALELAQSSFVEIEVHGLRVLARPDSGIVRRGPRGPSARNLPEPPRNPSGRVRKQPRWKSFAFSTFAANWWSFSEFPRENPQVNPADAHTL